MNNNNYYHCIPRTLQALDDKSICGVLEQDFWHTFDFCLLCFKYLFPVILKHT